MNTQPNRNDIGTDRRQAIRMPYQTSVRYANSNETGTGRVRDVSFDGLFFETPQSFAIGDQLALDFRFRHGAIDMAILGEITRITPQGVGVRLIW